MGSCLFAQDLTPKQPSEALATRSFLEGAIMLSCPDLGGTTLSLSPLTEVNHAQRVETQCKVSFLSGKQPLAVRAAYLHAVGHNVELGRELTSPWRLRRATLVRVPNRSETWRVDELVFGMSRSGADGTGQLQKLREGRLVLRGVLDLLHAKESAQVKPHKVVIDLTVKSPTVTAQVRARGKDYKKLFRAVETTLGDRDKKTAAVFRQVMWRGDETPLREGVGGDYTVVFKLAAKAKSSR